MIRKERQQTFTFCNMEQLPVIKTWTLILYNRQSTITSGQK